MNKPRTIEGKWWILGRDQEPQFGVLTFDPEEGITLETKVGGPFADLRIGSLDDQWGGKLPNVILGQDEHNHDVSLYCGGVGATSASFGLKSIKCHPLRAILGDEFKSWVSTKFKTGVAHYTLLHNWMGSTLFDITQPPGLTDRIEVRARDKLQVRLPGAVEFVILPTYSRATDWGKVTLTEDHLVEFRFDETVAIDTISDKYIQKFRRFLSLMTQRPVFIEEIKLRSNEWKTCELLHENRGVEEAERDLIHQHILVSYHDIKERFSEVLQKWYELEAQVEDALDLYFATIFNPNLYSHQVILSLAQALEVYHRSSPSFEGCLQPKIEFRERKRKIVEAVPEETAWLNEKLAHANEKTLAQRLRGCEKSHASLDFASLRSIKRLAAI